MGRERKKKRGGKNRERNEKNWNKEEAEASISGEGLIIPLARDI